MAIFDIFKKTKTKKVEAEKTSKTKAPKETPREVRAEKVAQAVKPTKRVEKKQFSEAYRILESPHITEKSTALSEKGIYVFKAKPGANKQEIKKAIQDLYGVAVARVNIVNIPRKLRRLGRSQGYKSGYKKALVKLAEGEKIEVMPR